MSKAIEGDSVGRPSRSSDRSRRQFHPASQWWEDLGQTAAQCLPGPTNLNAIDHSVARGPGAGPTGSQFLSGCCQRCLVGISNSSTRSSLRHKRDGNDSLSRCVQFGLGSPVRLTLDTGTVVSISSWWLFNVLEMQAVINGKRLPTSSEVSG